MVKIVALSRGKERNIETIEATFSKDGELIPLKVNADDRPEVFNEINKLISDEVLDVSKVSQELFSLMSPEAKVQKQINSSYYLSSSLSIRDGHIFFGDQRLEETLANHMMSLLDEQNAPKDEKMWRSYVKFLDNLHQNANEDIRKQLFRWMEYENKAGNGFGITEDGCLVGYKGCGGTLLEPMSKFTGFAIVDGVEYNGHIPNKVGSVVQMPRSTVQNDPSIGCSVGLHVGTRDYAVQWAPVLLLVKVNPRDVVSVPYECDSQKMRVCEYTVLKVTDASEEHKMYHGEEISNDDDYNVLSASEAYNLLGENIYVEYGNDLVAEGKLVDVYEEGSTNIIIETEDGEYVDIEIDSVSHYQTEFKMNLDDAYELLENQKEIHVDYDGKSHEGLVVDVYEARFRDPGVIVKSDKGEYKHIKLHRIENWHIKNGDDKQSTNTLSEAINQVNTDILDNAIEKIYNAISEGNSNSSEGSNQDECEETCNMETYKELYTFPVGTKLVVMYDNRSTQLQLFVGEIVAINKCDMEITLRNAEGNQKTISFTDIVSVKKV